LDSIKCLIDGVPCLPSQYSILPVGVFGMRIAPEPWELHSRLVVAWRRQVALFSSAREKLIGHIVAWSDDQACQSASNGLSLVELRDRLRNSS